MRIFITAKTRSRNPEVIQIDQNHFRVAVKEPPISGRANEAIIEALAEYMDIAPSDITMLSGHTGKKKVFEIAQ